MDIKLDELAYCESRGKEVAVNPYDGGSPSYGLLQFKVDTFVRYAERYHVFPEAEAQELENLLMSGDAQRTLARVIIETEPQGWRNWFNCGRKIGLDVFAYELHLRK